MPHPFADRITTALATYELQTTELLQGMVDLDAAVIDAVSQAAARRVAELAAAFATVDDPVDGERLLAHVWCELKCEWHRLNQVMQYQLAGTGEAEPRIWLQGSVTSGLLAALEPLLPAVALDALDTLLADPLHGARPDAPLLQQLRELHVKNGKVVSAVSAEINGLFRDVLDVQDRVLAAQLGGNQADAAGLIQGLVGRFDTTLAVLRDSLRQDTQTPFSALWLLVKADVERQAEALGVRCQCTDRSPSDAGIDAQDVETLLRCWFAAVQFLLLGQQAESTDERLARDKSLHRHLTVTCTVGDEGGEVSLADDGPGLAVAAFGPDQAGAWERLQQLCLTVGVRLTYSCVTGESAMVTLRWTPFRYEHAEHLMIVRHSGSLYALPVAQINRVIASEAGLRRAVAGEPIFHWQDRTYRWVELPAVTPRAPDLAAPHAVLMQVNGMAIALGIDMVEQLHSGIVQPIATAAFQPPPYLRGIVRFGGTLCLAVDPTRLVESTAGTNDHASA